MKFTIENTFEEQGDLRWSLGTIEYAYLTSDQKSER